MERYISRRDLERDVLEALRHGDKVIAITGPRGSGKTTFLREIWRRWRDKPVAMIEVEPITASPEILYRRFVALAEGTVPPTRNGDSAYGRFLASLARRPAAATLFLDEITELRTLSYFPGAETPLKRFLESLAERAKPRSLVTSRFPRWLEAETRALRPALRARIETISLPPFTGEQTGLGADADALVRATGGLPLHLTPVLQRIERGERPGPALAAELAPGGRLEAECRATLAQLLHRARGYGACKAVLSVLADEEGLNLTEVAKRLDRTAGSTRDYLRWLEEVELVRVHHKRFHFTDPVLRLWLRLYGRGTPPSLADIRDEVDAHLGVLETRRAPATPGQKPATPRPDRSPAGPDEDLIEID